MTGSTASGFRQPCISAGRRRRRRRSGSTKHAAEKTPRYGVGSKSESVFANVTRSGLSVPGEGPVEEGKRPPGPRLPQKAASATKPAAQNARSEGGAEKSKYSHTISLTWAAVERCSAVKGAPARAHAGQRRAPRRARHESARTMMFVSSSIATCMRQAVRPAASRGGAA